MNQDQRSLTDQLLALYALANRNGLYDAADYVHQHMDIIRELTRRPRVVLDGREIASGTRDACAAAHRLLSGECERSLRAAQHLRSLNNQLAHDVAVLLKESKIELG